MPPRSGGRSSALVAEGVGGDHCGDGSDRSPSGLARRRRLAPLSGPLVVAEVLGVRRSSTRLASHKPAKNSKKNKYVLKRREDLPPAVSNALPGVHSSSQPPHHAFLPSLPDSGGEPPVSRLESNYFLQKREAPSPPFSSMAADLSSEWKSGAGVFLTPDSSQKPEPVEIKKDRESSESMVFEVPVERSKENDGVDAVMEKVLKRTREDLNDTGEEEKKKKKKRKKKKDVLGADHHAGSGYSDHRRIVAGRSLEVAQGQIRDLVPQEDGTNMELPPGLDLNSLSLSRLVGDLSSIALDPFYGDDEDAPAIVRHVFLRFRSLVYQKSLVLGSGEQPSPAQTSAGRDGRAPRDPSSSSFQKKTSKFGYLTKSIPKRDPSNRQDELSVKKMKKMNQLKQLASKKRAAMTQNNSNLQQQNKDQKETALAMVEATRKPELPPAAPKLPSPTFLLMKFPPRSILPSEMNLKARFARFGPLDPSATRVYWKSHTCKVLFKYKSDAQSAYDFVKNNQLFGQAKVYYYLRDLEISGQDQPPDSLNRSSDKDAGQYRHGNSGVQIPSSSQLRQNQNQNQMQLKSILKKPGGDDSYNPNSATTPASSGANVREIPRVKFMLKDDEDLRSEPPVKAVNSNTNGGGGQVPKSLPFPPPPPAPPLQLLQPHRIPLPPPPAMPPAQLSKPRVAQPGVLMQRQLAPAGVLTEGSNVDISGPMLSLLLKCNDIVGRVKSSLGYTPYHML